MFNASKELSRRKLIGGGSRAIIAAIVSAGLPASVLAAAERVGTTISDVHTMTVQGPTRTYVFVKIDTADGQFGIAEGYGSPGMSVADQVLAMKLGLIGKNPLEIDQIYTFLGPYSENFSGSRTDGSAHGLMRAASAIEMALWDLAGKLLDTPTSILMGGQFRDHTRVYDHSAPRDMFDKGSCREWADQVRADPSGFTAHKIGVPRTDPFWSSEANAQGDNAHDVSNRQLTTRELIRVTQGFENIREAIGWDHDIMVHCHWEYNLRTSIELANAVAPIKPLWLEDPLPVDYTDSWKRLTEASPVPIHTGENLVRREGFLPFIINIGCDIVNPDLRNSGGFLETKRIADMATLYGIPMTTHNTASQLHTYQVCQWAASIRDFMSCETVTGRGGWMDEVLQLDGPYIEKGYIRVHNRAGTGVDLNRSVVEAHLAEGQHWWGGA